MSIALEQGSKPIASGDRDFMRDQLHLSPDGSHVAYNAISAGRTEVFVAAFPSFTGTVQVSSESGVQPIWSRDGKDLSYLAADKNLKSALIRAGASIQASARRALSEHRSLASIGEGSMRYRAAVEILRPRANLVTGDSVHVITRWDAEVPSKLQDVRRRKARIRSNSAASSR
jgi:hypothetical protein